MKSTYLKHILFCLALLVPLIIHATVRNVRFQRLTINDGLSLSSVYCIYQDSRGFMWFGTEDGLNRFDGKSFTIYRPDSRNSNSISHKWIEIILEDSRGNMWFGSRGGVTCFNPAVEQFRQYTTNTEYRLPNDTVLCLKQIDNHLFVGTRNGVCKINITTGEIADISMGLNRNPNVIIEVLNLDVSSAALISRKGISIIDKKSGVEKQFLTTGGRQIRSVYSDSVNHIIVGDGGVYRLGFSESMQYQLHQTDIELIADNVLIDSEKNTWLSSPEGLHLFTEENGLDLIVPSQASTHSLAIVNKPQIVQSEEHTIWFITHGNGAYRVNIENMEVEWFRNNACDVESISEDAINTLYYDKSGTVWFGTFGAGIFSFSSDQQRFELIKRDPTAKNTLASDFVWTIFEDEKERIWVGSNDKGVTCIDEANGIFTLLNDKMGLASLSHVSVRKIYQDSQGIIWFGTDGGGLNRYDEETGRVTYYKHDANNPHSISDNSVRTIYEDYTGNFWVGTRNGLNLFDRENERFIRFQNVAADTNTLSHNFVYAALHRDTQNNLWIGTYGGGLNKLDIETGNFERFMYDDANPSSISDNIVFSIYEDIKGYLWVGTNAKLNKFDPATGNFVHYGLEQGLPNEVIYGIVPDKDGKLWLSTNLGICRFDPVNEKVINFDVNDGLQSNEFNGGAFHKGNSGRIYFGGVYGLNILQPEDLNIGVDKSKVVFTRLEVMGNEVKVMPRHTGNFSHEVCYDSSGYHLPAHIAYVDKVVFSYKHRHFSIEFADLGNLLNTDNEFAFRMVGLDLQWQNTGTRNYVSYANLSPGTYELQVRAKLNDGTWSKKNKTLKIVIKPPFWFTWWFIAIILILLAISASFVYRYLLRVKTLKLLEAQNKHINEVNAQLKQSEQDLKLLNATKDKFFSIVSHDLKNPFASVLSISEVLKDNFDVFDNDDRKASVKRVHGSLLHIYSLLENLLTWSRTQTGRIEFNPTNFNLSALLQENMNLYTIAACKKNIEIEGDFESDLQAYGDRDMINSVIRNLLNNAVKYTPSGKRINLGVKKGEGLIKVFIRDEGTGISPDNQLKLFRIDEKVKVAGTAGEKGTGLGLIICKEFVEKNGGKLCLNSKVGSGSTFSFTLMSGK